MEIYNKTVVITGGGDGMGREMVLSLLSKGAKVAAIDLNLQSLLETKKLAGSLARNLSLHECDISKMEGVMALPNLIVGTWKYGYFDK